jgi:hypothetical protein
MGVTNNPTMSIQKMVESKPTVPIPTDKKLDVNVPTHTTVRTDIVQQSGNQQLADRAGQNPSVKYASSPRCSSKNTKLIAEYLLDDARNVIGSKISEAIDLASNINCFFRFRVIWAHMASILATYCLTSEGKVNALNVCKLNVIFSEGTLVCTEPYSKIKYIGLVRSCVMATISNLLASETGLRNLIDELDVSVGNEAGKTILSAISIGGESLTMQKAVLIALLLPHVQLPWMPTCAIDAYISELKMNNPCEAVEIFKTILTTGNLCLKSGYVGTQPQVCDGKIMVNIKNCPESVNCIFGNQEGVKFLKDIAIISGSDYKVYIPIFDMNDILFADIFKLTFESFAKNMGIDRGCMYYTSGISLLCRFVELHFMQIKSISDVINYLRQLASELHERNPLARYMRVITVERGKKFKHMENIYIDNVLRLDVASIGEKEIYPIGNRGWITESDPEDIKKNAELAIVKISNMLGFVTLDGKLEATRVEMTGIGVLPF